MTNGVNTIEKTKSFETYQFAGMTLDPIPGSSLAGVMRAYTAMKLEAEQPGRKIDGKDKPYYPNCAGLGQPERDGAGGHCGKADCPVCTVFGFAKGIGASGGFAGLAAFSDMQVLLFPVASQLGPQWITCPMALRQTGIAEFSELDDLPEQQVVYRKADGASVQQSLNLGWLFLPAKTDWPQLGNVVQKIEVLGIPGYIISRLGVVSDKLFTHIVNSNLEVRTSVAIDPATGAAEEGALFTYEALPRGTVLFWEVTCRTPKHFKINQDDVKAVDSPEKVREVVTGAYSYLEHLGIGGMGSRGMGRLRVLATKELTHSDKPRKEVS
jgi:CRISPR-associated protein Cmr4